jgi:hypothetical protein
MRAVKLVTTAAAAPADLSAESQALWAELSPQFTDTAQQILLEQALILRDHAETARRIVASEGMTTKTATTGAMHIHPLARYEVQCRQQFAKIWRQLNLDAETNDFI